MCRRDSCFAQNKIKTVSPAGVSVDLNACKNNAQARFVIRVGKLDVGNGVKRNLLSQYQLSLGLWLRITRKD